VKRSVRGSAHRSQTGPALSARFHDLILDRRDRVLDKTIQAENRQDAPRDAFRRTGHGRRHGARYYLAHGAEHLHVKRRRPAVAGITSAEIVYKPHGLVGLITPWNYPFLLGIADALSCASWPATPVMIKPSELTPLSAVPGAVTF